MDHAYSTDKVLDVRGWSCPWILLKAKSLLKQMGPGQILEVISTDPEARRHFPSVLENGSDRIVHITQTGEGLRLFIRRG